MTHFIRHDDALDWLPKIPSNTFDACVTDPPYEIGILGHGWDKTGIAYRTDLWGEVLRVLKPGARLLAFGYPTRFHRMVTAIEDAGFRIDDQLVWLKGGANMMKGGWVSPAIDKHLGLERRVVGTRTLSGTAAIPTSERGGTHSVGVSGAGRSKEVDVTANASQEAKSWAGWSWQLKPSHEPICLARKPFKGSAVSNLLRYGTGALNVMGAGVKRGPGRVAVAPNILLDSESSESLSEMSGVTKCASNKNPTKQSGKAFHGNGKPQVWAAEALNMGDEGTAARYFPQFNYVRKANRSEKQLQDGTRVPSTLPSVKPEPLMEWLITLVGPPGGKILDPFSGSGSTIAAAGERWRVFGIEKVEEHYDYAMARTGAEPWNEGDEE